MIYNELISKLFIHFPMLKKQYNDEGDYIEGLPHLCYEIVFVPFIRRSCLDNDQDKIHLICDFLEIMANSKDELVSELLAVSVLESILSEREVIHLLKRYLGIHTKKLLTILEKKYGWGSV